MTVATIQGPAREVDRAIDLVEVAGARAGPAERARSGLASRPSERKAVPIFEVVAVKPAIGGGEDDPRREAREPGGWTRRNGPASNTIEREAIGKPVANQTGSPPADPRIRPDLPPEAHDVRPAQIILPGGTTGIGQGLTRRGESPSPARIGPRIGHEAPRPWRVEHLRKMKIEADRRGGSAIIAESPG